MKTSKDGQRVEYEAKDYPHATFAEILAGMNASNEARKPSQVFVAFCEICVDRPGFESLELMKIHDREKIEHHRKLMAEHGKK